MLAPPVTVEEVVEEVVAAPVSSKVPPGERAADWRVYEGIDLGGRCQIKVFYSTTTHDALIRKHTEALGTLLEALQVRPLDVTLLPTPCASSRALVVLGVRPVPV